jgi:uncharacterized surface protein with fasciclin (FAS1) repeats
MLFDQNVTFYTIHRASAPARRIIAIQVVAFCVFETCIDESFTPLGSSLSGFRTMKLFSFVAATLVAGLLSFAPVYAEKAAAEKTVVEIAVGNEDFSTLVAAVKAAGLVETLSGKGPFTVFAPTNAAFEKLPKGTVESLLKPENKDKLVAILTYHVVAGKVMAADAVKLDKAKTVNGAEFTISTKDGNVMLNNAAKVVKTDIAGSNGVIHVIDSVILPPEKK